MFQKGLRMLLKDPIARHVERTHLHPTRNHVVFHFDPKELKRAIDKRPILSCMFITGKDEGYRYMYADTIALEILVGVPATSPEFRSMLGKMSEGLADLFRRFGVESHQLIQHHLRDWGFLKGTRTAVEGPRE